MKKKQTLFALLLAGALALSPSLVGQELEQSEQKTPPLDKVQVARQVLADLHSEVLHIPEPQWFEMMPAAELYAEVLIKARSREIADDEEATRLVKEAWNNFQATIETMLTPEQKAAKSARRTGRDAWRQELSTNLEQVADTLRQKAQTNGSVRFEFGDDGVTRSIY